MGIPKQIIALIDAFSEMEKQMECEQDNAFDKIQHEDYYRLPIYKQPELRRPIKPPTGRFYIRRTRFGHSL